MRTVFFFIHGAWASPISFNYIRTQLAPKYETAVGNYDCQKQTIEEIIESVKSQMYAKTMPTDRVIVVGHSLGGLIALSLEKEDRVDHIVTIASPLNGIHMNRLVEWFLAFKSPIIHSITDHSVFISKIHNNEYRKPIDIIMATCGFNPMINELNDCVIPLTSQDAWVPLTATLTYIEATHFDILQHEDTVIELKHIGERINGV